MNKLVLSAAGLSAIVVTLGLIQVQAQSDLPKTINPDCWATSFN